MPTLGHRFTTLCVGFLLVFGISTSVRAQEYTITDLGDLWPDMINASGLAVGYAPLSGSSTVFRASIWEAGVLTLLPTHVPIAHSFPQEATFMRATAINRKGQTVGLAVVPSTTIGSAWGSNEVVAFLYDRGQTTFFTFPSGGVDHSSAHAITDKGLIAGLIYTPYARGVLYDLRTGTQTTLPTLGGTQSAVNDVNETGVAIGWSNLDADRAHAFRYTAVTGMEDLGTLENNGSNAHAINDQGVIVGNAGTVTNTSHAFSRTLKK